MRKAMVAGNWKMNGSLREAASLMEAIKAGAAAFSALDIVIFPSYIQLPLAQQLLSASTVAWGAQNMSPFKHGAYTGEISGQMLTDFACQYVLIGHSERRQLFHEDLNTVAAKFKAGQAAGLIPILCIGETLAQREANQTEKVITEQLESVIKAASIDSFRNAIIAYEPVWAIGTGLSASPEQAQAVHVFIRGLLEKYNVNIANALRILYGGSVKADNAAGLFAMPDIDGALVGGASLDAKGFLAICQASLSVQISNRVKN